MVAQVNAATNLAIDAQSLGQLRAQARQSPEEALKAAAQQFEAVFMNMMLKSMRETTPQEGMFDSEQTRMFTGMLDQQLTQNMSGRGIGLADMMVRQLSHSGLPLSASRSTVNQQSAISNNTQQDFLKRMLPFATQASLDSGVPLHLMLGQAALESGWGKQEILMADGGNSHNLFGVKANAGWQGKVTDVMTTEYRNGVAHKQVEKFRAYSSYAGAFQDYANMIGGNLRYADVLRQGGDVVGMAQAIQKAGYATDPKYADKLALVMGMTRDLLAKQA